MGYKICGIPGDGVGQEVIPAAQRVLESSGFAAKWTVAEAGWETFRRTGRALPERTLEAVRDSDATLFGAVSSPSERIAGYNSPIVELRRALNLYACVRPVQSFSLPNACPGVDLVVIRENTEGLYSGVEAREGERATALRIVTRSASRRIAQFALTFARANGRRRITVAHKANVLRETCGLFRETVRETLADGDGIEVDEMLADAAAYWLARKPERFDILLTTNLFGDILSDVASAAGGGLGISPSANMGDTQAIFEPVHGSAPDIAGKGIANPAAAILAAAMMLDFLGEREKAQIVRRAVFRTLESGPHTPDLGGAASTEIFTQAVVNRLES